jgi:hypothetical protein
MTTDEQELLATQLPPIPRVLTTNDGEVMVPARWVRDLATIFDLTAENALDQEDRNEASRYVQHIRTISQAINSVLDRDARPKAG